MAVEFDRWCLGLASQFSHFGPSRGASDDIKFLVVVLARVEPFDDFIAPRATGFDEKSGMFGTLGLEIGLVDKIPPHRFCAERGGIGFL